MAQANATTRGRANQQAQYSNEDNWGPELNAALQRLDDMHGVVKVNVENDYELTVENFIEDEARSFGLILLGTGGFDVTIPKIDKAYFVLNFCLNDCTIKAKNVATGVVVKASTARIIVCDGTQMFLLEDTLDKIKPPVAKVSFNNQLLENLAPGTQPSHAVNKQQLDGGLQSKIAEVEAARDEAETQAQNAQQSAQNAAQSEQTAGQHVNSTGIDRAATEQAAADALQSEQNAAAWASSVNANDIIAKYESLAEPLAFSGLIKGGLMPTKTGHAVIQHTVLQNNYTVTDTLHVLPGNTLVISETSATDIPFNPYIADDTTLGDAVLPAHLTVLPDVTLTVTGTAQLISFN